MLTPDYCRLDSRDIKAIYWDEQSFMVGSTIEAEKIGLVTRIEPEMTPAGMWFLIWKGNDLAAAVNGAIVEKVVYV